MGKGLTRPELAARRERVRQLRAAGLSQAHIAGRLGVDLRAVVNDCRAVEGLRPLCRHCGLILACRPRGLCSTCYMTSGVREATPTAAGYHAGDRDDAPDLPRRAGDAPCRCLWCRRWLCQRLMQLCRDCQESYERAARGMPEASEADRDPLHRRRPEPLGHRTKPKV